MNLSLRQGGLSRIETVKGTSKMKVFVRENREKSVLCARHGA
jgi:hypothetical protein